MLFDYTAVAALEKTFDGYCVAMLASWCTFRNSLTYAADAGVVSKGVAP
jgi:hypothetical protein